MDASLTCVYATDTGRKWCNCRGLVCTEIECRNVERIAALRERTDGASFHTKFASADQKEDAPFVLVRSGFCNEKHCVDFRNKDGISYGNESDHRERLFHGRAVARARPGAVAGGNE